MPSVSFRLLYNLTFVILVVCSNKLPLLESISQERSLLLLIHLETNLDDLIILWDFVVIVCFVKTFPTKETQCIGFKTVSAYCLWLHAGHHFGLPFLLVPRTVQNMRIWRKLVQFVPQTYGLFSFLKLVNYYPFNP